LSEGVEPTEIVLVHAERNRSGFLLPVGARFEISTGYRVKFDGKVELGSLTKC